MFLHHIIEVDYLVLIILGYGPRKGMLWIELTRNGRVIASNIDNMKNDGIIAPHKEEFREVEIKSHPVVDLIKEGNIAFSIS